MGEILVYATLSKALYGNLQASLLFWWKLTGKLKALGFEINPTDWCVSNKNIDGEQCTIIWHVGDPIISQVKDFNLDHVIYDIKKVFDQESLLTKQRGAVYDYLGRTLD